MHKLEVFIIETNGLTGHEEEALCLLLLILLTCTSLSAGYCSFSNLWNDNEVYSSILLNTTRLALDI